MFPGIEGNTWSLAEAHRAFREGGVDCAILSYQWKHPFSPFENLTDYETNRNEALQVADNIIQYRNAHPEQPIDLVGYSGGGGMVVMVAEALPEDIHLRNIILVHAAISRDYDLTKALRRIDGRLVNFYSEADWLVLGLGTQIFGTIDRKNTVSAGMKGLDLAKAVPNIEQRHKVKQHAWSPNQIGKGHLGGHFSINFYAFNKMYVVPYVYAEHF